MVICHFKTNNKRQQVLLYFEFSYFNSGKMPKKVVISTLVVSENNWWLLFKLNEGTNTE